MSKNVQHLDVTFQRAVHFPVLFASTAIFQTTLLYLNILYFPTSQQQQQLKTRLLFHFNKYLCECWVFTETQFIVDIRTNIIETCIKFPSTRKQILNIQTQRAFVIWSDVQHGNISTEQNPAFSIACETILLIYIQQELQILLWISMFITGLFKTALVEKQRNTYAL